MDAQISMLSGLGVRDKKALGAFLKGYPEIPLLKVAFYSVFGNCCMWWLDQRDSRMNYIGLNAVAYFLWKLGVLKKYTFSYDHGYFRPGSIWFNVCILHPMPFLYNITESKTYGIDRLGESATCFLGDYHPTSMEESNLKISEIRAIEKIRKLLECYPINTSEYSLLNDIAWLDLLASVSCITLDVDKAHPKRIDRGLLYQNWTHYIGIDEVEKAIEVLCRHSSGKKQLISIENWNY